MVCPPENGKQITKETGAGEQEPYRVAALYQFTHIADPEAKRLPLLSLCEEMDIRGTLLLAHEGLNGTIAGPSDGIAAIIRHLESWPEISGLEVKYSTSRSPGFLRMKVRLKSEIVTMGKPGIDPRSDVGTYVDPEDWNALIRRQDVMVIDTRNTYETRIGRFARAVDPGTETFREFPAWADDLAADTDAPKAVAMYCTGGIRCEKASAYMKQLGIDEVYHLRGGILKYLETIPQEESLWEGECFVFDERVGLGHKLVQGEYELCHACKEPVSAADRADPRFEKGVSCPRCASSFSDDQRQRFRERQRQITLAETRGEKHLGTASSSARRHRRQK